MLPSPKVVPRVGIPRIDRVRSAAGLVLGSGSGLAPSMIWATRSGGGPATSGSPTPNTTAPGAATPSTPTCPTGPRPRPATPIGSGPWPFGWSSRTAYPIRPPVDTSGTTIASSSPSPPSRTGWRPGEKRRPTGSGPTTSIGPSTASRDTSPLTSYTMALLRPIDRRQPRLQAAVLRSPRPRPDSSGYPEVLPTLPGGPDRPGVDPPRGHHRRFGPVSTADLRGLRRGGASGLSIPYPGGAEQGRPPRHRSGPQATGGAGAEAPARAPGTPEAKRKARRRRHLQRKVGDLFEHRHLFVKRHLAEDSARHSDASRGGCLSCGPSGEWWRRSTGCSTAGAAPRRP